MTTGEIIQQLKENGTYEPIMKMIADIQGTAIKEAMERVSTLYPDFGKQYIGGIPVSAILDKNSERIMKARMEQDAIEELLGL